MKLDSWVKAFTIMEVVIAALVATLVITMAYTAYLMMNHAYLNFTNKNDDMQVLLRLDQLLKRDFNHSQRIMRDKQNLLFEDSTQTVRYEIGPEFIIRSALISDTFKIKTTIFNTAFAHHFVPEEGAAIAEAQPIDELALDILFRSDTISYHYNKNYSSKDLIRITQYAIN
ncbi:PulJ/GspJ family protein [Mucilaginibacter jinjuensis]|uniref:Prepilin-type N-terminal cleavage/methylation domain-containing protein n=1 Tax=Mucilaginibacter jinjuensis TaxID=1176721 RepID=A0ABY7TBN6_9SPHI|nr:hypothetical protein [Mucilaginibacter jinjuensis]WCT13654.1 hypothetical protein PQO05_06860 [Mucilaginibacter jinjuensis]